MRYLDKLEAYFKLRDPVVRAFVPEVKRFERVRRQAVELLARHSQPDRRPPLFGVPVGVKDIFHVEGIDTRAGSRLPPEELRGKEADCVTILKQAGALILGKTVTTEFAYFAPGITRNPHNLDHTPGGSSSGSAAAVSSGLCPLALGTQTIGSIIRPASFCGVIGYKPSYDRISRAGVIPLSPSLDHVGFFPSDLKGAKMVASLLCKDWEPGVPDHKPLLGIPEGPYLAHASTEGLLHYRTICRHLSEVGFGVKSMNAMPDFDEICARHELIMAAEMAKVHKDWFAKFANLYHPITRNIIVRGQSIPAEALRDGLRGREKLRIALTKLMIENNIDLLLSPAATGPAPKGLDSTGNPVMNLPWTHSGLPTLNLPSGLSQNRLPMGLQITAAWYNDEQLLAWSEDIMPHLNSSTSSSLS